MSRGCAVVASAWVLSALALGCGGEPESGPVEVVWDRDGCERCQMLLSEPRFAAEVRTANPNRIRFFDDLGCAVNWIEEQQLPAAEVAEIWVRDSQGEGWLDARRSWYRHGEKTPMGYGFAARREREPGLVDFETARREMIEKEHERRRPPLDD